MPELNYKNLLELGKEYVKERPIAFQSFAHYDFFEWLRQRESAQQSVQRTCANCGASDWVTAGFPVSREYCKRCGASR